MFNITENPRLSTVIEGMEEIEKIQKTVPGWDWMAPFVFKTKKPATEYLKQWLDHREQCTDAVCNVLMETKVVKRGPHYLVIARLIH